MVISKMLERLGPLFISISWAGCAQMVNSDGHFDLLGFSRCMSWVVRSVFSSVILTVFFIELECIFHSNS